MKTMFMKLLKPALLAVAAIGAPAPGQTVQLEPERFPCDESHPAAGFWLGNLAIPPGSLFVTCEVTTLDDGSLGARVTALNLGAVEVLAERSSADGRTFDLSLRTAAGALQFTATVSDDGQRLTGPAHVTAGTRTLDGTIELGRSLRSSSIPGAMAFRGKVAVPGAGDLEMAFVLAATPGGNWVGHMDVPAQGLRAYPLINVRRDGRRCTADIALPGGATLDVELDEAERAITGRLRQSTVEMAINFQREDNYMAPSLQRPQEPRPPLPYEARQIIIKHPAGHVIAGTLTLPPGGAEGRGFPAALLISGSGQQDRDETLMGHKPFLVIADYLTRHGIAVMRCDDRGVGDSTGADTLAACTSGDFATDAMAVVNELKTIPEIDASRIGLIGHSEGGVIAPMVADMAAKEGGRIAFVVLLAAPAVSGREILKMQNRLLFKAQGASDEAAELIVQRLDAVLELATSSDADPAATREAVRQLVAAQVAAVGGPQENANDQVVDAAVKQLGLSWLKVFATYDPRPLLAGLKCPVLACAGTLDLQVWHEQNLPVIEQTIREADGDVTILRYQGLNHLFQPARTGGIDEYAAIDITFDETVLRDLVEWIKRKVP